MPPRLRRSAFQLPAAARARSLPRRPIAQLATLVEQPPEGDQWLHEIKFDGYRMFARVEGDVVQWISRNGRDWSQRLASLSTALRGLPCDRCLLDGEVVVVDRAGVSSFQRLQNALRESTTELMQYYAFDCLHVNDFDLSNATLLERKDVLARLLKGQKPRQARLRFSDHHVGDGAALRRQACAAGLEGIISKRAHDPYLPGRNASWLKSKCRAGQEFVIAGFTEPTGSRQGFGALLLGYFDRGDFIYAGRVGTGFDESTLKELSRRLRRLETPTRPFASLPKGISVRGVHWVRPHLVAQVEFSNWTDDNLLRQAAYLGLREDKPAHTIRRDAPKKLKSLKPTPTASRVFQPKSKKTNR